MELLELLKNRFKVAEAFTKDFHESVEKWVQDYECEDTESERLNKVFDVNDRYYFKIPYIFATHESMMSSMFEKVPELIISGRLDSEKGEKVRAGYDYLVDKLSLDMFMNDSAWWFILAGNVSAHAAFKSVPKEIPLMNEAGEPILDEAGEAMVRKGYEYNDPIIEVDDPLKTYWSPESVFSNDAKKVPYCFYKTLMPISDIKRIWGVKVESDAEVKVNNLELKDKEKDDIKRATVYFYFGEIPEENEGDIKGWEDGKPVFAVFVNKKMVYTEVSDDKPVRLGKWYGTPNKFFGFGIGKTLSESQRELSLRRSQEMRYADIAAFPKLAVDGTTEIDKNALLDPRENVVLLYTNKPPAYLQAPDLSNVLLVSEDKARQDAQFISGMLDLSKGAQEQTIVKTAYGQSVFANAAEKRIQSAKRLFGAFYRECVIMLLKLAQDNWDEEKVVSVTDSSGQQKEVRVTGEDFKGIDFDRDIDIDIESITVNKEVLRAQAIEFYDRVKDDPIVKRDMVVKDTLRDGFNKKNPEAYINEQTVNGAGQLPVGTQGNMPLAQPSGESVPSNPSAVLGNQ